MDNAKLYLGDLLGVAAAGSVQPQGGIWRSYFAAGDGQQEATAWNSGLERLSCEHAAALNAACAHVMDMDDVHNASITHLGAVTIPAALAVFTGSDTEDIVLLILFQRYCLMDFISHSQCSSRYSMAAGSRMA